MATKTRKKRKARSAAQKRNDSRLGQMARARARGKTTKVRAKRRARRRSRRAVAAPAPMRSTRRARRRGRRAGRRAKHRAKSVRRGRSRGRHRRARRARRFVLTNPMSSIKSGAKSYLAGLHPMAGYKAATTNGWKGFAAVGAGAVGTVFVGTLLARLVMPTALKMAPSIFGTPWGARALSFGVYYTGGFAIAKFTPGISQKTRDAIMFGALVASVLEIVKPGAIQLAVSKIPVVGETIAGHLSGIESELADYVDEALQGLGITDTEYDGSQGFHGSDPGGVLPGRTLSEIARISDPGVADYLMGNYTMGAYEQGEMGQRNGFAYGPSLNGLGCPAADDGSAAG